ncbi:hypothetical protein [Nitrospira sp. Nam74]
MNVKALVIAAVCMSAVVGLGLALSNPTLTQYRQSILTSLAYEEVNDQEQIERKAVEREAASIDSYFSAANYEGRRLDILTIQRQYPRLGASLASQLSAPGATLSERLMQVKEGALQRITVTHEAILYSLLADLSIHTTRTSYGLWSSFSTCHNNRSGTYLAVAGQFFEQEAGTCVSP